MKSTDPLYALKSLIFAQIRNASLLSILINEQTGTGNCTHNDYAEPNDLLSTSCDPFPYFYCACSDDTLHPLPSLSASVSSLAPVGLHVSLHVLLIT